MLDDPDDLFNEKSEYEPEEPGKEWEDPGAEYEDPEFDVTTGEELADRLPSGNQIPDELARTFWALVFLSNVALFGVSLGAMMWYFWGWSQRGGGLLLIGLFAAAAGARRYYRYQEEHGDTEWSERTADAEADE